MAAENCIKKKVRYSEVNNALYYYYVAYDYIIIFIYLYKIHFI